MYHPTRGGVRGGKDQFTWDQVKTDKDRECYLGHSLMAPIGRWQEGKDLTWYAKDDEPSSNKVAKVSNEFRRAKELEEEALMAALGYKVVKKEAKQPETLSSASLQPTTESSQSTTTKQHKVATEVKHGVSGPPKLIEFDDKKTLDALLLKLIQKHGLNELVEALSGGGGEKKGKSKKSKKKGKKRKNGKKSKRDESSDDDDSSEKSEYEEKEVSSGSKRKKGEEEARGNKKSKKREESSDDSSSSDTD
jgi:hypothetical protein